MTKNDLTKPDPLELVNVQARLFRAQRDLIDQAVALRAEGNPDYTLSDYVREVLTLQAAIDCKVEPPVVPDITRGRGGSVERQAAAKLGMSLDEFTTAALRSMAVQVLQSNAIDDRPGSGTRAAVRPGSYAAGPRESERPKRLTGR